MNPQKFFPSLHSWISELIDDFEEIPPERKRILGELVSAIRDNYEKKNVAQLVFICTHNSRRSQFAQVLAQACAKFAGLEAIESFSGGTEITQVHPTVIKVLEILGFRIAQTGSTNPNHAIQFGPDQPPLHCFSKKFGDPPNPTSGFIAVMTCTDADEACPFVPGASHRIALPYEDPKISDGTVAEIETYGNRARQIAAEMLWVIQEAVGSEKWAVRNSK